MKEKKNFKKIELEGLILVAWLPIDRTLPKSEIGQKSNLDF